MTDKSGDKTRQQPTPRTDALQGPRQDFALGVYEAKAFGLARQLERELAAKSAILDNYRLSEAPRSSYTPTGYRLAPIRPTEAMLTAADDAHGSGSDFQGIYYAMLDAADAPLPEYAPTTNAAPQEINVEASSPVQGEVGKVQQSEGAHTHPVPTREAEASCGAAPVRPCTCHPDDNPPRPCPQKYALAACREAARSANAPTRADMERATLERILAKKELASSSTTPIRGWCIRHTDGRWRTMDTLGMPDWTDDPAKALCCRLREHADAYAADDPDDVRIVEAVW